MTCHHNAFAIELPIEGAEINLRVEGTATPYDPGVTSGPPERCYPPEGGEAEIEHVRLDGALTTIEISSLITYLDAWDLLYERVEARLADNPTEESFPDDK